MRFIFGSSIVSKVIIFLILITYSVITYWLFYPYEPIIIKSPIKITALNPYGEIHPGDFIIYELDMDKKMPLPAVISKQLINGFVITYSPIIGNVHTGKFKKKFKLLIPKSADEGEYVFYWEGIYQVNPIRKISVKAKSKPFKVTKNLN